MPNSPYSQYLESIIDNQTMFPWENQKTNKYMDLEKTNLEGVIVLRPKKYDDPRGFFTEIYSKSRYKTELISEESVQFNFSHSKKDVLRGLHFQMKKPQGKIVQVLRGTIFDVGVDIRKGSKTFW